MKCAFCELPEIKKRIIIKNNYAFAIPSNMPIVPGHLLICPIRCIAKYEDLNPEELNSINELISKLKFSLSNIFKTDGFNFAWNEGKVAGQSVPHFHLHMVPRKDGDSGIYKYEPRNFLYRPGVRKNTKEEELQEIAKLIRESL